MSILYITYMGLSEPLLYSQGLAYLEGLSQKGFKITILSFEKKEAFDNKGEAISKMRARLEAQGIRWKILRYHKRPYFFSTFFDITRGTLYALYLKSRGDLDLIHARGTVPAVIAYLLHHFCGMKFLFDVRGLMAEEYVDGGMWKRGGLLYRMASHGERLFLRRSDGAIFLSHRIVGILQNSQPKLYRDHRAIQVIPSCVDLSRFSIPKEKDVELQKKFGLQNRFVFIYIGSLGTWYLLDEMLDFFKEATTVIPNAFFLILTQSRVESFSDRLKERDIRQGDAVVSFCLPREIPRHLSLADAGLFFIRPCFSKLSSCPTKFGEYLASGLPVVINASIGDTDTVVEKEGIGVVLKEFHRQEYRQAALRLTGLIKEEGVRLRQRCREVAEKHFSLQMGIDRYGVLYQALLRKDKGN